MQMGLIVGWSNKLQKRMQKFEELITVIQNKRRKGE